MVNKKKKVKKVKIRNWFAVSAFQRKAGPLKDKKKHTRKKKHKGGEVAGD